MIPALPKCLVALAEMTDTQGRSSVTLRARGAGWRPPSREQRLPAGAGGPCPLCQLPGGCVEAGPGLVGPVDEGVPGHSRTLRLPVFHGCSGAVAAELNGYGKGRLAQLGAFPLWICTENVKEPWSWTYEHGGRSKLQTGWRRGSHTWRSWGCDSRGGHPNQARDPRADSVPLCHTDMRACPVSEDLGVPKALKVG